MKKVILGLAVALIAFFGIISFANAGYDHNGNYGCNADHPCVTATATPTPTKTCDKDKDKDHKDKDWDKGCQSPTPTMPICNADHKYNCPTETPTPTVTETPSTTPTPTQPPSDNNGGGSSGGGQANTAPVCSNGDTIELPANPFVVRKGDTATVNFFITQGDNANIYYKVVGQPDWQFSVPNLKPNDQHFVSYTITGLNPQLGYTFGIQQTFGCGGGNYVTAVIVDGASYKPVIWNFSYWEWSK